MSGRKRRSHGLTALSAGRLHRDLIDVGHLLRRAGFGAAPHDILVAAENGREATVNNLIAYDAITETLPPPPASISDAKMRRTEDLAAWWIGRMITTQRPLQEKMTLFWHGHFATAVSKVGRLDLMYKQNQLFRDNAIGRFDDLLLAVTKDPAMLIWLDGARNVKGLPNENWGREVMELFALGRGNYTEDDVHACSRCFTGWRLDANYAAVFVPRLHDDGPKTLLGQTGNWTAEDAVRILAAHSATGPFLANRLWRFFASDNPPDSAIKTLAQVYYESDHRIRDMLTTLFTMPEFYSPDTRANHVKSPTEFVVSTIRQLALQDVDVTVLPRYLMLLGQELFNPPNVGGWPAGTTWINGATMLERFNFASRLTGNSPGARSPIDGAALVQASGVDNTQGLMFFITNALGMELSPQTGEALMHFLGKSSLDSVDATTKVMGLLHLALASPEYQVS